MLVKNQTLLISTAGYTQLIDKLTYFFSCRSSWIDLIFCVKPEIVSECQIDHSLFQTGHFNFIFAKISANISLPPSYSKKVQDQNNVTVEGIQTFKNHAWLTVE